MRQGGGNVVVKYSRADGSTKLTNQPHFLLLFLHPPTPNLLLLLVGCTYQQPPRCFCC